MLALPDPTITPLFPAMIRSSATPSRGKSASIADHIAALERREARRRGLYWRLDHGVSAEPVRWFRSEPRPSIQYAGHISTEAARDPRLARGAVALLLIIRARVGHGVTTETTKTTLAHTLHVTTRTIGRWLRDLVRFGYIEATARVGQGGLYTGLRLKLAEKVLPCFRKLPWLSGWLAQNAGTLPSIGGIPDRTELSHTNHSSKESSSGSTAPPDQ